MFIPQLPLCYANFSRAWKIRHLSWNSDCTEPFLTSPRCKRFCLLNAFMLRRHMYHKLVIFQEWKLSKREVDLIKPMKNLIWSQEKIPPGTLTYNCHSAVLISSFCLSKIGVIDMFLEVHTKLVKSLANLSH